MDNLLSIEWAGLFGFTVPALELVIRGSAMYWFLFLVFRFVVRRDVGAVGIADLLVLFIVADAAQNAMAGEYTSISDGMVLVSTLIAWNLLLDWLSFRFDGVRRFAEPPAMHLIKDGRILKRNLRREWISDEELWTKLREHGVDSIQEVKAVYLEADGEISVIKREKQAS
ncbi:DUF421 domain-containing protein [Noviherbaspirillum cavernae]|uniref:DUF421 domain-containing protein n=1 Tax=Noviherbaspirillum cavernae TaxID=2320862 RepID=A0A418X2Q7_9BURK|nr:YetF domain-containing protein [Noviherbaspirillum cavernae]RJG06720.1 DUF421 domain-containing protein [Noviherbaspirillum cavernae]